MSKILAVAVREYLETIKTKAFLFGLLVMPVLIAGLVFGATKIARHAVEKPWGTRTVAVVGFDDGLYAALVEQCGVHNADDPEHAVGLRRVEVGDDADAVRTRLSKQVESGEVFGFLEPADGPSAAAEAFVFNTTRTRDRFFTKILRGLLRDASLRLRLEAEKLTGAQFAALIRPVELTTQNPLTGKTAGMAEFMTPFVFMFLIFMGAFGSAGGLLTSVIEEKSNRVIEVLLSALSPMQLMTGKIVGLAAIGFTLVIVWGGTGYAVGRYRGMEHLIAILHPAYFMIYYVLGFLMISAFFAGIGAACNTIKEAQSLMLPVNLVFILPMMMWFYIVENPNAPVSVGASFFPPLTPFLMVLRLCSDEVIPVWQIVASTAVLVLGVIAAMWAAAKVFRVGILMYGKPPSLKEIVRWVAYK